MYNWTTCLQLFRHRTVDGRAFDSPTPTTRIYMQQRGLAYCEPYYYSPLPLSPLPTTFCDYWTVRSFLCKLPFSFYFAQFSFFLLYQVNVSVKFWLSLLSILQESFLARSGHAATSCSSQARQTSGNLWKLCICCPFYIILCSILEQNQPSKSLRWWYTIQYLWNALYPNVNPPAAMDNADLAQGTTLVLPGQVCLAGRNLLPYLHSVSRI